MEFIKKFDNVVNKSLCEDVIELYEQKKLNHMMLNINDSVLDSLKEVFWICYGKYAEEYTILNSMASHHLFHEVRVQKLNEFGENWHCEHDTRSKSNLLQALVFLNDIDEGSELEFSYQKTRIPAKCGTMVIFPTGFTHTYRVNPPLKKDSYILSALVDFNE